MNPSINSIPVHDDGATKYIRLVDIPAQYREQFNEFMRGSQMPVIDGEVNCFYPQDWQNFVRQLSN